MPAIHLMFAGMARSYRMMLAKFVGVAILTDPCVIKTASP